VADAATIFALASARGRAGVAVIRVSGSSAHDAVRQLCGSIPTARKASLRKILWQDELIDEAIVVTFDEGHSFTGEKSAEFQIHGSVAVVARLLRCLGEIEGLRVAEPGEFTRRAMENGRLDLTQVEGLADLVDAETEAQRRQAMRVMSGALGARVADWRAGLIRAAALIEATIDFADEEVPVDVSPEVRAIISGLLADFDRVVADSRGSERVRDGFEVAIIGSPNAGKSTLLNALAGREAAITSEIAGTTRDVIEVRMDIAGLPVTLLDTAGLRESADLVEQIGIARAIGRANAADLRLFLLQSAAEDLPVQPLSDDITVLGKGDLTGDPDAISGLTGQGIDRLLGEIGERLSRRVPGAGLLIRERQRNAVLQAAGALRSALVALDSSAGASEIVALELRSAIHALEVMVGRIGVETLLGEIFASFCIGK